MMMMTQAGYSQREHMACTATSANKKNAMGALTDEILEDTLLQCV